MHSTKFLHKKKHLLFCSYEGSAYGKWEGCVWIFSRPIAISCRLYLQYKLIRNNFRVKISYSNYRSDNRTCWTNKYRDYRHHWWVIGEWLADRMETIVKYKRKCLKIKQMHWGKYILSLTCGMVTCFKWKSCETNKRAHLHTDVLCRQHVGAKTRCDKMNTEYNT